MKEQKGKLVDIKGFKERKGVSKNFLDTLGNQEEPEALASGGQMDKILEESNDDEKSE
ncbi:hypothetical protein HC752_23245 [Vibrio sp. S9_S30]|uniref:hypothetical protein n=1 Tax=Vibrio sp. S9_S30 TaxID=2720226 RepID=UPI0016803BCD|nr:hypothetical protein [Vibrio sp. S9_S30]MBD1559849.1 hypothetical protein [Vibrio sp. S9_S30]